MDDGHGISVDLYGDLLKIEPRRVCKLSTLCRSNTRLGG
jgi:hypothetical protein